MEGSPLAFLSHPCRAAGQPLGLRLPPLRPGPFPGRLGPTSGFHRGQAEVRQPKQPGRSGLQPAGTEEVPESGAPSRGGQCQVPTGQCGIATLWGHRRPWARDELEESQRAPTQRHRCVSYRDCAGSVGGGRGIVALSLSYVFQELFHPGPWNLGPPGKNKTLPFRWKILSVYLIFKVSVQL